MKIVKYVVPALFAGLLIAAGAQAETAVIVNKANANSLTKQQVAKIFLGKSKKFPDGTQAVPVDQSDASASRGAFNAGVLGKSASQLKSYWSRLIFTGKGTPPKDAGVDADVKGLVSANPNIIGYIDAGAVDDSVKVVLKF